MFKIIPKKISLVIMPALAMSLLVGCSQTEVEPSYSEEFKNQYLYMANTFNEQEEFTDLYHAIQWDETNNAPYLPKNMTITSYSETEIETEFVKEMSDIEFEMTILTEKLYEYDSMEEEEYEQLYEQYSALAEKYYEELEMDEKAITKTDNVTAIAQCLVYAMMGEEDNEDAIALVKETFSGIGLIQSLMGMRNNEYVDFVFNNIYLVDDEENIYGKLSYNIKLNHDKKALVQTMKFVKYYEGMEQEIEEFEKKLEEFEKEME